MKPVIQLSFVFLLLAGLSNGWAASKGELRKVSVPITIESITRGADMVAGICMGCHSLKYISYRDLLLVGIPKEKVDAYRGERGLDEKMMSFTPAENLKPLYGMVPPDLSLMAQARKKGASYIFSLLTGYHTNEEGQADNKVFPGIRMPDILGVAAITESSAKQSVEKNLIDAVAFLEWTADPHILTRHEMGKYVIIYLIVLTLLLYLVKRKVWADVK